MTNRNVNQSPTAEELLRREREDSAPVTRREFREVRNAVMSMKAVIIGEDEYKPDPNSVVMLMRSFNDRIASLEHDRNKHRKITWAAITGAATATGAAIVAWATGKH